MKIRDFFHGLQIGLIPILLLTFFWQTRIAVFNQFEVYDYLIPFLYLSDILIIVILISQFVIEPQWLRTILKERLWWGVLLLGLIAVGFSGLLGEVHVVGLVYRILKLAEFFLFALWVRYLLQRYTINRLMTVISLGLMPLLLLGLMQMVLGESLGLKLIGEWEFSQSMPGISKVEQFGLSTLRPYATFPHPNVFGGVMGIFLLYWLSQLVQSRREDGQHYRRKDNAMVLIFSIGLIVSFSRSAWVAVLIAGLVIVPHLVRSGFSKQLKRSDVIVISGLLLLIGIVTVPHVVRLIGADVLSFSRRWELNKIAFVLWREHPLLGVGLNQFILQIDQYWNLTGLTRFNQPVHNIILLILVEMGAIGVGLFLGLVWPIIRGWRKLPLWLQASWLFILITGMVDHYWWTLQAGMLMLFLLLGLSLATMRKGEVVKQPSDHP